MERKGNTKITLITKVKNTQSHKCIDTHLKRFFQSLSNVQNVLILGMCVYCLCLPNWI